MHPGESRYLLSGGRFQARCRLSSSSASSSATFSAVRGLESPIIQKHDFVKNAGRIPRAEVHVERQRSTLGSTAPAASPPARGRFFLRIKGKTRGLGLRTTVMANPPARHPDRRASHRNLRKYIVSARRQALVEHNRKILGKPYDDWRWTLNLMIRHTPKFGEALDLKVRIGRGTAALARAALSDLDTSLWEVQRRHHCKILIESGLRGDEPLVLSLSGTSVSVWESLSELSKDVGRVLAVRVLDPKRPIVWPEEWTDRDQDEAAIRVLRDGHSLGEGETLAAASNAADPAELAQRPKNKVYRLATRADEIPRPTVWTKSSFEQYVARLVLARVPTHLHQSLYPVGPSHQATVVHLLTTLFSSEDLRGAISVKALKMALHFIQSRGPVFRPAARAIFYQVELQHLPLDAEAFQTFLTSASRAGDLQAFNSILTAMYRKGHCTQVATWTSFLAMIRDPHITYHIIRRMRSRGLLRLRPILEQIARQKVVLHLERRAHGDLNIQHLLNVQDRWYGRSWLDTMTLNRMVDILGAHGNLGACYDLLDTVDRDGRVRPDDYTLNTMMTHARSMRQKLALLSRWPGLQPDVVTYQQLFQVAWKQRLPNVLRVIWRYSVFAGLTNSHMRHTLTKLMRSDSAAMSKKGPVMSKKSSAKGKKVSGIGKESSAMSISKKRRFLKAWEDVILGGGELAAGRLSVPNRSSVAFGAAQLSMKYLEDAGSQRPLVRLESKLSEAYDMDMQIHKLNRQGVEMTPTTRESLTVDIPLGIKK